jgi:hypothetical protein
MTPCSLVETYRRFRGNILSLSTESKSKPSKQQVEALLVYSDYFLALNMEAEHSSETGIWGQQPAPVEMGRRVHVCLAA